MHRKFLKNKNKNKNRRRRGKYLVLSHCQQLQLFQWNGNESKRSNKQVKDKKRKEEVSEETQHGRNCHITITSSDVAWPFSVLQFQPLTSSSEFWASSVLVTTCHLRALLLDPPEPFPERGLHLPFRAVNLVLGYPLLPLGFRVAEPPRLLTPLTRIRRPSRPARIALTRTVAFPAHDTVWAVTRPVPVHIGSLPLRER